MSFQRFPFRKAAALLFVLFFTACGPEKTDLTLLHFNDFHAQLDPLPVAWDKDSKPHTAPKAAGVARLIAKLKKLKNENTLVLNGGDMLMGSAYSTIFRGRATFALFSGLVDYMVVGNHEFDYGQANLRELMRIAGFKVFTSNVFTADGKPLTEERWFIREINGIKVGIFGLTTTETPITTYPKNVEGLVFRNEAQTAREMVKLLRDKGAQVIVAMTHMGLDADETLARDVAGIDIIIGAHSHSTVKHYRIKNTWIAQAASSSRYLGRIDISFDRKAGKLSSLRSVLIPMKADLPEDPAARKQISVFKEKLDKELQVEIGDAALLLDGSRETVRNRESNLANLIADTMLDISRAEMVFINGGGIRESIQKGRIKVLDVINVLPFNNTITTMDLPGSVVLAILKKSASLGNNAGGLVHVSRGLKYTIKGKTLGSVTFKGQPLDPARLYRVATSNFMAAGGDGYSEFKQGKRVYDLGITMSDALQKRIMADKTVTVTTDGRLQRD